MTRELKISIAMTTFNGAKYILEQLESFAWQTRLPDELIVTDDGSTDNTVQILEEFALKSPFEVRIYRNEVNLGYARNFDRALSLCTGDLIFLSDQDDVWFDDKIEVVVAVAINFSDALLFINDAELALEDCSPLGLTQFSQILALGLSESEFTMGCCMALRKELLRLVLPVSEMSDSNDAWINKISCLIESRYVIKKTLQYYRRHCGNASSCIASSVEQRSWVDLFRAYVFRDQRIYAAYRFRQLSVMKDRLERNSFSFRTTPFMEKRIEKALLVLRSEQLAIKNRLRFMKYSRCYRWFFAFYFYFSTRYRHFSGWKSLVKDVFLK